MSTIQQFDFSVNLLKALLWQDQKAANLQAILEAKQSWYDENQTAFWQDWVTDVFDLRTANDFGCVVWAIILGVPASLLYPPTPGNTAPFGFGSETSTPNVNQNFYGSNFAAQTSAAITFSIQEKRLILQLRYRKLISRGTIPEINKMLADLITPTYGKAYMLDNLNMTQTLVCQFVIPYNLNLILSNFDVIPRPAGVKMNITGS